MAHEVPIDADYKFLGDLSALNLRTEYRSIKESPADTFYRPCLQQSSLYKRAAGYFRSTIFLVTGPSVLSFVRRGGKVRLICSPELDSEDIDAIALGYARRSTAVVERLAADIDQLLSTDSTAFNTRLLATLVSVGALEIKIAFRADRKGLYHELGTRAATSSLSRSFVVGEAGWRGTESLGTTRTSMHSGQRETPTLRCFRSQTSPSKSSNVRH